MEDFKRNAGVEAVHDHHQVITSSSTEEAVALKRRKLVVNENGAESVFDSPEEDVVELGATSLGENCPRKSSFLCSDRSPEPPEVSVSESSCCSSNDSGDAVKVVLPRANSCSEFETADSTSMSKARKLSPESTPPSEICANSGAMKLPGTAMFPPRDEIEAFFAEAEKSDQKRFSEKYNFDIVNEFPLDGRFKWVCLKP